ncbi:DR2241 family protein [Salarchaeum sp. JOR-1]|uniref:DR2241 family protein n=1 Tax=Salarchaeum sp. JOR-1 TaxID=2599399 RepID=UPI001F10F7EF|nr:DR2241 family protein [Salarchaeum sp. JOR-1]
MSETVQVAALIDAATDGVEFDGLRVEDTTYGYRFETPAESHRGLSTDELGDAATGNEYVANWYYWQHEVGGEDTPRRAFLRWVEHATGDDTVPERLDALRTDGLSREWGELLVTAHIRDGEHVYEVRHQENAADDDLETYTDPLDARQLVKHDDDGKYRPLSTAPSLPHGWVFTGLSGEALVRTVDFIYPATVANWHREREGELDVTHYREAADRQSGIYEIVSELTPEQLEWATEACCVDSQCLKRREWEYDEDTDIDTPAGGGAFPCREPCSLFVAAARKFVTLERDEEREYTFELTPTEKEQIEDIIGAVADGRTDEIREADVNDGANRYRARYLRAKRMDDRGLSGTPTYDD